MFAIYDNNETDETFGSLYYNAISTWYLQSQYCCVHLQYSDLDSFSVFC